MTAMHGIGEFPEKSLILIEEKSGLVKSIYAQYIAVESASAGKSIHYISRQTNQEIYFQMKDLRLEPASGFHVETVSDPDPVVLAGLLAASSSDMIIVEQFSLYFIDTPLPDFFALLVRVLDCVRSGRILIFLVDRGVLPDRHEALLEAMADGIVQITAITEGDKIKRYLNIPKMKGSPLLEKMLPFTVTDEGFLIDTRERHG